MAVDGRLQIRTYEAQDGTRRQAAEVVADTVQFLDWPRESAAQKAPVKGLPWGPRMTCPSSGHWRRKDWQYETDALKRGRRRKVCIFCVDKVAAVDYKDTGRLRRFITERGKILPRRISGNCARHQRQLTARSSGQGRLRCCPAQSVARSSC